MKYDSKDVANWLIRLSFETILLSAVSIGSGAFGLYLLLEVFPMFYDGLMLRVTASLMYAGLIGHVIGFSIDKVKHKVIEKWGLK